MENNSYDLILMDLQMARMGGEACMEKIISVYGDRRPKIVALTASKIGLDSSKVSKFDGVWDKSKVPEFLNKLQEILEA